MPLHNYVVKNHSYIRLKYAWRIYYIQFTYLRGKEKIFTVQTAEFQVSSEVPHQNLLLGKLAAALLTLVKDNCIERLRSCMDCEFKNCNCFI